MTSVFVYGTLMPGRSRWATLAGWAQGTPAADRVRGTALDTGAGYPGLVLDGGGWVPGFVVALEEEAEGAVLTTLDGIEGVAAGLYRRVPVTTERGVACWTYEYLRAAPSMVRVVRLWHG